MVYKNSFEKMRAKLSFYLILPNAILSFFLMIMLPQKLVLIAGINLIISYIIYFSMLAKEKKKQAGLIEEN